MPENKVSEETPSQKITAEVDMKIVQESLNKNINNAISMLVGNFDMRKLLSERIGQALEFGQLGSAIEATINEVSLESVKEALQANVLGGVTITLGKVLDEALVEVLLRMRGFSTYEARYKVERERLLYNMEARRNGLTALEPPPATEDTVIEMWGRLPQDQKKTALAAIARQDKETGLKAIIGYGLSDWQSISDRLQALKPEEEKS